MKLSSLLMALAIFGAFVAGVFFGAWEVGRAYAESETVGCYAKGGVNIAGWCVSRSVIIR